MMCGISSQLGEHRLRTKYNDIEKANLAYRKQRRHTHKQTRKMIMNQGYSGNDNRTFCKDNNIETSFTQKGKAGTNEVKNGNLLRYPHGECG